MCLTAWCAWLSPLVAALAALAVLSPVSDLYCWLQGGTSATPRLAEPPALPVAPLSELEIAEQTVKVISLLQLCPRLGSAKVRLHSHDIVLCCIACGCCTPLYGIACGCCSQCQMLTCNVETSASAQCRQHISLPLHLSSRPTMILCCPATCATACTADQRPPLTSGATVRTPA